jgi:hypothetical protein
LDGKKLKTKHAYVIKGRQDDWFLEFCEDREEAEVRLEFYNDLDRNDLEIIRVEIKQDD